MTDLVERYVRQVGRYLPKKDRTEIETELRSLIQDQLDDRYGGTHAPADIATVLTELGDPRRMAASYRGEQYLIGPALYPYLMLILGHGWLIVPSIVVSLSIFGALIAGQFGAQPRPLLSLVAETALAAMQATSIFSGVVVLIFAIMQRLGFTFESKAAFNPLSLPAINDPSAVDRREATYGSAFGLIVILMLLYFLSVGGLTLRFTLSDPGEVIPIPPVWTVLFIGNGLAMIALQLLVLRRNRWTVGTWLIQLVLEVFGVFCMYFVIYRPIFERLVMGNPGLATTPILSSAPEIIAVGFAVLTLLNQGSRLIRLWNYGNRAGVPAHIGSNHASQ